MKFGLRYSPTAREMPLASGMDSGYCDAWACSLCHWHEPEQVSLQTRCLYGALNSRIPLSVIDMLVKRLCCVVYENKDRKASSKGLAKCEKGPRKEGLKLGRESVKGSTAPSILFPIPVAVQPLPRWTGRHPGKIEFAAATAFRDNGSIRSWSVPVNRMADRGPWAGCYPRLRPGRPAAAGPGCIRSTLLDRARDGKAQNGCENASSTSAETGVAYWEIGNKVKRSNHYVC